MTSVIYLERRTKLNLDWFQKAACKGKTELFYPVGDKEKTVERRRRESLALTVCRSCDVMFKCRDYARKNGELGVWGGETENQRFEAGFITDVFVRRRYANNEKSRRRRLKEREERAAKDQLTRLESQNTVGSEPSVY